MDVILFILIFLMSLVLLLPSELFYRRKKISSTFLTTNFESETKKQVKESKNLQLLINLGSTISRIIPFKIPSKLVNYYTLHINLSNNSKKISVSEYLYVKNAVAFLLGTFFLVLFINDLNPFTILIIVSMTISGYFVPDNILMQKSVAFQKEIMRQIPLVFSSLSIVVDAGLNMKQALIEVTKDQNGALIEIVRTFNKKMSLGGNIEEEIEIFLKCTKSQEINQFVALLVQSDKKGGEGFAKGLKELTTQSWEQRKTNASILAEKASIKLFLPMLFLVFPAILIVMVGPLVFSITEMFK